MKSIRPLRILILALTFVCGAGILMAVWVAFDIDHMIVQEVKSPSGDRTAVLHYLGEGESVPYGEQLVIRRSWMPLKNHFGDPIFAGDCEGSHFLRWRNNSELELHCAAYNRVHVKLDSYEGIRIVY